MISTAPLHWTSGYEYALVAIRKAIDAGVALTYTIDADGPERARVRYTIFDLELDAHVTLGRGMRGRPDVLLSLRLDSEVADLIAAKRDGIAVVAAHSEASAAVIRDGVEGILVPSRNPSAAAAALKRMQANVR